MSDLPPIDMDPTTSLPPINTSNLPTSNSRNNNNNQADYTNNNNNAAGPSVSSKEYQEKAIAAIARKKQRKFDIPKIDFTQHQLENGEIVRTDQRVVKDVSSRPLSTTFPPAYTCLARLAAQSQSFWL
jgi:hypothetical protein